MSAASAANTNTPSPSEDEPILEVRDLQTYFFTKRGVGKAVDGVSFFLRRGETLGLVGESGCGKSMTCLSIIRLHPKKARIVGGEVLFRGTDLLRKSEREMRLYRRRIGMILQDPMAALNPVFTIGEQIQESLRLLPIRARGQDRKLRAAELLRILRIPEPETRLSSFPHELSGGMRQRAVGAIILAGEPEIIVADEPTTALDVTIQAAYLELLKDLQRRLKVSIIFVTHDFSVVARMCDRVAVMYAGKIVESTDTKTLFTEPAHPYSESLLLSVPDVLAPVRRLYSIEGQPPSIFDPPSGCRFHPRCPLRDRLGKPRLCETEEPALREILPGHLVACHFGEENMQTAGMTKSCTGIRPSKEASSDGSRLKAGSLAASVTRTADAGSLASWRATPQNVSHEALQ
jgi:oligopeptide/dipeptide ABC transporter ATP-binding protein